MCRQGRPSYLSWSALCEFSFDLWLHISGALSLEFGLALLGSQKRGGGQFRNSGGVSCRVWLACDLVCQAQRLTGSLRKVGLAHIGGDLCSADRQTSERFRLSLVSISTRSSASKECAETGKRDRAEFVAELASDKSKLASFHGRRDRLDAQEPCSPFSGLTFRLSLFRGYLEWIRSSGHGRAGGFRAHV